MAFIGWAAVGVHNNPRHGEQETRHGVAAFALASLTGSRNSLRMAQAEQPKAKRVTGSAVPSAWLGEVERVLITQQQISRRVRQLARQIERDFRGRDLAVVSLLSGTVMFLADLIRHLSLPLRLDFMGVSSYRDGTESRELVFTKELKMEVLGRDVLVVDDILDTGKTLKAVLHKLRGLGPRRIKVCVLLEKEARRVENVRADYVGFQIPDLFVIGYGLDFAERYRNLPFIAVLKNPEALS